MDRIQKGGGKAGRYTGRKVGSSRCSVNLVVAGFNKNMQHKSVLLQKAINGLEIKSGDIFVDGTLGGGGHSEEVCKRFAGKVTVIGIDLDSEALERSKTRLSAAGFQATFLQGNFRNIDTILNSAGFHKVDKILLDIGLSSNQFEDSGRGFSFPSPREI